MAYRLRKLRELQNPGRGRIALGLAICITLAEIAQSPATTPVVPAPLPAAAPPAPVSAARAAYAPLSYNARHDKAFGGCSGQLILSSAGLQFNCPGNSQDSMQIAISEITGIDENGVRLASGKKLHFSITGMTKPGEQALFTDWFNRLR